MRPNKIFFCTCIFVLYCLNTSFSVAESDGEEFLGLLNNIKTANIARAHIDDVWKKWDGTLFCISPGDQKQKSRSALIAVQSYLENNSSQLFRPRRYLIIQGLREKFSCD